LFERVWRVFWRILHSTNLQSPRFLESEPTTQNIWAGLLCRFLENILANWILRTSCEQSSTIKPSLGLQPVRPRRTCRSGQWLEEVRPRCSEDSWRLRVRALGRVGRASSGAERTSLPYWIEASFGSWFFFLQRGFVKVVGNASLLYCSSARANEGAWENRWHHIRHPSHVRACGALFQ
jgi:hypothetical protein